jgi:multicomponent Na+:H+ antiporter subunit B
MSPPPVEGFSSILVRRAAGALVAPAFVVAGVLLLRGEAEGGDGFAAAVAVALGVVLRSLAREADVTQARPILVARWLAVAGLGLITLAVVVPALAGGAPLSAAPEGTPPKLGVLALSTVTLFDAAVALVVSGMVLSVVGAILREVDA